MKRRFQGAAQGPARKARKPDQARINAFVEAARDGDGSAVDDFLKQYKSRYLDLRGTGDKTALMWAARRGHAVIAARLLDAGASVNILDRLGGTALVDAAVGGHAAVAGMLIAHGVKTEKKTRVQKTALWYAEVNHHPETAAVIRDAPRRLEAALASFQQGLERPVKVLAPLRLKPRLKPAP